MTWIPAAHNCAYCGQGNARTKLDDGRVAHRKCITNSPRIQPVQATQYRTVLAPGAPWPFQQGALA